MSGEREALVIGADHADKIGKVVTVDVENKEDRVATGNPHFLWSVDRAIWTGVLTGTRDEYESDSLERTVLVVGGEAIIIRWDRGDEATIQVHDNA